jgi:hypothetical protein
MKKSKFSDSQIVDSVKRVEAGQGVPDICRELDFCTATRLSNLMKTINSNANKKSTYFGL